MIVIIDYGMGNLRSVQKALESVGHAAEITSRPRPGATRLEGGPARRRRLRRRHRRAAPDRPRRGVSRRRRAGKPCLGVCLGLQLLFDVSEEDGLHEGLGLLPGRVVRFASSPGLKVPHMGWNTLRVLRPSPLLAGLGPDPSVYFVHSYYARPDRSRRRRRRVRLPAPVRGDRRARQPDGLPVPPREEPARRPGDVRQLRRALRRAVLDHARRPGAGGLRRAPAPRRPWRPWPGACRRSPTASRTATVADVPLDEVAVGDTLVVFPHEICPVDGVVLEGHGARWTSRT